MTDLTTQTADAFAKAGLPKDRAALATRMLQTAPGPDTVAALLARLPGLRPPAPRTGQAALPFLSLIAAAHAAGEEELAAALGLVMRGRVQPRRAEGPAGRYLTGARYDDLTSRLALRHTAAALGGAGPHEALRRRYATLYPYWRDPTQGAQHRVLLLNRLPNLRERDTTFVHNQSNLPNGYAEHGVAPGLAMDVLFLVGTDFDACADQITRPDVIYNNIQSAEILAREEHAALIHRIAQHFDAPLINAPEKCLPFTRVGNAERIGEQARYLFPKTQLFPAGFDPADTATDIASAFDWPVILRDPYGHMGAKARLAHSHAEAEAALAGLTASGAYAIQYYDYPQKDGLYYRFRIFKVGETVFSSRIHVAEGWNVHGKEHDALKAARPELGLDALERQFWDDPTSLVPPETWQALEALLRDTGADTMGCDFTLAPDGRALIFELNASMHIPFKGREAFEALVGFEPRGA